MSANSSALLPQLSQMRCPVCNVDKWRRRDWFNPQWQQQSPVVRGHVGGDFDRCKDCYNYQQPRTPAQARSEMVEVCSRMVQYGHAMLRIEAFVSHVLYSEPVFIRQFKHFGAVTCESPEDPHQQQTRDGRWVFDPTNKVYEKAFWMAWPDLVASFTPNTLGNVLEAILGVREAAVDRGHPIATNPMILGVCLFFGTPLAKFCRGVVATRVGGSGSCGWSLIATSV